MNKRYFNVHKEDFIAQLRRKCMKTESKREHHHASVLWEELHHFRPGSPEAAAQTASAQAATASVLAGGNSAGFTDTPEHRLRTLPSPSAPGRSTTGRSLWHLPSPLALWKLVFCHLHHICSQGSFFRHLERHAETETDERKDFCLCLTSTAKRWGVHQELKMDTLVLSTLCRCLSCTASDPSTALQALTAPCSALSSLVPGKQNQKHALYARTTNYC